MPSLPKDELSKMSQAFRDFYESLHENDLRGEVQIDTTALIALAGNERTLAESLLIEHIEGIGGPVIQALVEMKSQRGATALKEMVPKAGGEPAAEMAFALWQIEKWPPAENLLIDVLEGRCKYFPDRDDELSSDLEAYGRIAAVRALGEMATPRARTAIRHALKDPDSLVRHWAGVWLEDSTAEDADSDPNTGRRKWWQFWKTHQ